MAVSISGNASTAAVTPVKLRASLSLKTPAAAINALVPVSSVSYIDMTVGAELDTSGRYRYIVEAFAVVDAARFSLSKPASDATGGSFDFMAKQTATNKADSLAVTDLFQKTLIFIRSFNDEPNLSDEVSFSLAKLVADQVSTSEALAKVASKLRVDSFYLADAAAKLAAKALADAVTLADDSSIQSFLGKADAFGVADAAVLAVEKLLDDQFTTVEELEFSISKILSDGFSLNDGAGVDDGFALIATKAVSNIAFVSDAISRSVSRPLAHSFTLADGGLIVQQNYCDITYFAEDYVGSVTTF
jgi:hypothetical protein